ncbi:MAG: glycosyltransferase family 4 protein [Actinobacteria bacterium]|nr:glycosyltransferase family 4 protein [Actinomycetota bacterium]
MKDVHTATGRPIRVVMVVPPATELDPADALERTPTLVRTLRELTADGRVEVTACCATTAARATIDGGGWRASFVPAPDLAAAVAAERPDVVHVHGTGFVRTLRALDRTLPRHTGLVVQHHGEPPGPLRNRLAHRALRGRVDAWAFTGAMHGQAEPFRAAGIVRRHDRVVEVLEAASLLEASDVLPVTSPVLDGAPAVLWVGRLIESKDPVTAVRAFGLVADRLPAAVLHLLATDRTEEPAVRAAIAALGALAPRVHVHDPVDHAEMTGWYLAADVVLSTSRREGSGYSLIEAMTEGCIPVATGLPSHRSIVGDALPTFEPGDDVGAADLLIRAVGVDRDALRRDAAQRLSWAFVVEQLVGVYRQVLRPIET